ncbi:hypothetical protein DFH06DRAFT_1317748 [Mycena polygramma]|nr:hypothetical protein DFH06DRAFT_1317748 [Mycena polygramma]
MNPPIPIPTAIRTRQTFAQSPDPPRPVVLLLADTDIDPPRYRALVASEDIKPQAGARAKAVTPERRFTPYGGETSRSTARSTSPRSVARSMSPRSVARSMSPRSVARSVSPLTESSDDGSRPVAVPTSLIARPTGAQRGTEKESGLPASMILSIKTAVLEVATRELDLEKPYGQQDARALQKFNNTMNERFPRLTRYQDGWVLKGFATNVLKVQKEKLKKAKATKMVAEVNAAVNAGANK